MRDLSGFEAFVNTYSYVVKWDMHFPGDSLLLPDGSWESVWAAM